MVRADAAVIAEYRGSRITTWALSQLRQSRAWESRNVVAPVVRAEIRKTEKANVL